MSDVEATVARRAIVIDDDDVILLSCRRILEKAGYEVETCSSGLTGLERLAACHPQIAFIDLKMPELDGIEVMKRVRAIDQHVVIAVITGYATISTAVDAMKAGAYDFLPKPFTPDELRVIANRCHEHWRLAERSRRLQREKEAFARRCVTIVSHQLKSPVAAVKQYIDVLLHTSRAQLPDTVVPWLERSQQRLNEMMALVEDWLTLAKIEGGALCQRDQCSDLAAIITAHIKGATATAAAAGVELRSELVANLPLVRGDAVAIGAIVANLIDNAIKYNRRGGRVDVSVALDGARVRLEVSDTGIGIPPEKQAQLFEDFYRAQQVEARDVPGTGLGLTICKKILDELGGAIEVDSQPGNGTRFSVQLPCAVAPPTANAGG